jgi:hypothetical protein
MLGPCKRTGAVYCYCHIKAKTLRARAKRMGIRVTRVTGGYKARDELAYDIARHHKRRK